MTDDNKLLALTYAIELHRGQDASYSTVLHSAEILEKWLNGTPANQL
jgi:hypothetical protein